MADITERALWDRYQAAYQDLVRHTSTAAAPWYVVPADHKWFARVVIGSTIVSTLEKLDLRFPRTDKAFLAGVQAGARGAAAGRQGRRSGAQGESPGLAAAKSDKTTGAAKSARPATFASRVHSREAIRPIITMTASGASRPAGHRPPG